jgi:copper(I)-binding protein
MRQILRFAAIGFAAGFVLSALLVGAPGQAQAQTIKASNAWARRAPAMGAMGGAGTGAVYVRFSNSSSQADALVSASTDVAQTVELHETKQEGGVMKMRPVKTIPVPAGGTTELKPGGYHIMLLGLKHDLKPGDKVAVTLEFEHGGQVRVDAPVR